MYRRASTLVSALCCLTVVYGKSARTTIQRMEKFDKDYFNRKYYRKRALVLTSTTTHFKNATTKIFSLCQSEKFTLARVPSMTGETSTLKDALLPCGSDCYGIHRKKLCKEFLSKIKHPLFPEKNEELYLSIAKGEVEPPPLFIEEDTCYFQSSGVTEWRLLLSYTGTIDLFSQTYHSDSIATGDLLYIPRNTVAQHRSATKLALMLSFPCSVEHFDSIEVEIK